VLLVNERIENRAMTVLSAIIVCIGIAISLLAINFRFFNSSFFIGMEESYTVIVIESLNRNSKEDPDVNYFKTLHSVSYLALALSLLPLASSDSSLPAPRARRTQ